jgi:cell wall integrity and stress response component
MLRTFAPTLSGLVAILFIFLLSAPGVAAFTNSYCSPQNTANDAVCKFSTSLLNTPVKANSVADNWQYQSNGNCTNHCSQTVGTYAFAVIQYQDCWCSNLIPSQQVDIGRCQKDCPGYGAEDCGSRDDGLYIYIKRKHQPHL